MNLDQLQSRFGIDGRLRFAEGRRGLVKAELRHSSSARCELYLHGAHVTAWQPRGGSDVFFVSGKSLFQDGAPIRGGIPVIFPQFGDGLLPKHGLARTRAWQAVRSAADADSGAVAITLRLKDDASSRARWPHPFRLELTVALGLTLTLTFTVNNPGPAPFLFQTSLHTYFQVADIAQTRLSGLQGTAFQDFLHPGPALETSKVITFDRETDRLYTGAPDRVALEDRGNARRIVVAKSGMNDIVLWNPWIEKSRRMDDFGDEEYRRMVCVETGNIRAPSVLAPGGQWCGHTVFACESNL